MATWEMQLISRIVRSGNLKSVRQLGITQDDFLTNEGRALFSLIASYHDTPGTSGTVLGPNAMLEKFPYFQLCDDPAVTDGALVLEVRHHRLKIEVEQRCRQAIELSSSDPLQAIAKLQLQMKDLGNVGLGNNTDVHFHSSFAEVMHQYRLRKQGYDLSCGSWPWLPLQEATMGLQPEDYVIVYGRPKNFKTWVLAFLIAWFYNMGKRMVIYTKEMTANNIFQRTGACLAEIRYHEFRSALLSYEEEGALEMVERLLNHAQREHTVVCLSAKDAKGHDTVPWLQSKVEQYKPDVTFIDGLYLMTDVHGARKDNERVQNISRDIRQMILDTGVPGIATLQANRAAAKNNDANLDEVSFSDAIGQDATLLMRAIKDKDKPIISLVMGGAREFSLEGFRIYGIPATNFTYAGPLSGADIKTAIAGDTPEERKPVNASAKRTRKTTTPMEDPDVINTAQRQFDARRR